jgi:hypothetical protein
VRYWVASKRKPRATLQPTDIEYTAKGFLYLILVGAPEELAQFSATGSTATTTLARTTCRTRNAIT